MRGLINDAARWLIGRGVSVLGFFCAGRHAAAIRLAGCRQRQLRRRYRLTADTPVVGWGEAVSDALVRNGRGRVPVAVTSGSAGTPKRVPYPRRRVAAVRFAFVDMFARACRAYGIRRRTLYVFGPLVDADRSLTSLLLHERRPASALAVLQAPYRAQAAAPVGALIDRYGVPAVRLWVLALSNPGVLYSTNPATLAVFLEELALDWRRHVRLIRDFVAAPAALPTGIRAIARRLASRGSARRLARLAASPGPQPLHVIAPEVEAYICWTGGDLAPFLRRLDRHLPPNRYRRIPMYSMATETVQTTAHFEGGLVLFVPVASGVCYEFCDAGATGERVRSPADLCPGGVYSMIVSDRYGLRRYDTGDLFLCQRVVRGLPDLAFLRRREAVYSFLGEKVSAGDLAILFGRLREDRTLAPDDVVTCVPSLPVEEMVPHYKLLHAPAHADASRGRTLAEAADRLLGELNCEYGARRAAGRLGPFRVLPMTAPDLVTLASSRGAARPDAQFKLPALIRQRWEDLLPAAALPRDAATSGTTTPS